MIITHTNGMFYKGSGDWLDFFTWTGATVCFTLFLFAFGASYGIKLTKTRLNFSEGLERTMKMLAGYYIVAFVVRILGTECQSRDCQLWEILTFIDIPQFTEFILAFVLFDLMILVFRRPLRFLLRFPLTLAVVSIGIYTAGILLNQLNVGDGYSVVIKELLVGHEDLHRFGILPYFPVLAAGLYWGRLIAEDRRNLFQISAFVAIFSLIFTQGIKFIGISDWNRWPPSVFFSMYGMTYVFGIIFVTKLLEKTRIIEKISPLKNVLIKASKNTFPIYKYHIVFIMFTACLLNFAQFGRAISLSIFCAVTCAVFLVIEAKSRIVAH